MNKIDNEDKNLPKIVYTLLIASALYIGWGFANRGYGDQIPDAIVPNGMSYTLVISSKQIFSGNGTLYRIETGTGNGVDFVQAYDTRTLGIAVNGGGITYTSFTSATIVTPQYVFQIATAAASGSGAGIYNHDFSPYGIYITTGLYVYINQSAVGVNQAGVYYKR